MKPLKIAIALLIAVACIAYMVSLNKQHATAPTQARPVARATAKPRGQITVTRSDAQTTAPARRTLARKTSAPAEHASSTPEPSPSPTPGADTAEIEREAREALPRVGANTNDTNAWLEAINNSEIAATTRAALIGGLVDEGFSDPDNFSDADLPLIQARMQLIERISQQAIDEANTTAFTEVYRALQQAAERLAQDNNQQQQQ